MVLPAFREIFDGSTININNYRFVRIALRVPRSDIIGSKANQSDSSHKPQFMDSSRATFEHSIIQTVHPSIWNTFSRLNDIGSRANQNYTSRNQSANKSIIAPVWNHAGRIYVKTV